MDSRVVSERRDPEREDNRVKGRERCRFSVVSIGKEDGRDKGRKGKYSPKAKRKECRRPTTLHQRSVCILLQFLWGPARPSHGSVSAQRGLTKTFGTVRPRLPSICKCRNKWAHTYWTTSTNRSCPPPTCGPLITSGLRLLSLASVSSSSSFSLYSFRFKT